MFQLNNLTPLVKKRKRVGRGGKLGGTSGKGHKGQKARSGPKIRIGFEGGQMPLFRRLPKRGFSNFDFGTDYTIVNLQQLEAAFQVGETVTKEALLEKGILKVQKGQKNFLLKVLGSGKLSKKLVVHADAFSESAIKAIENCGGEARLNKEI